MKTIAEIKAYLKHRIESLKKLEGQCLVEGFKFVAQTCKNEQSILQNLLKEIERN